jgi:hypothetical protein
MLNCTEHSSPPLSDPKSQTPDILPPQFGRRLSVIIRRARYKPSKLKSEKVRLAHACPTLRLHRVSFAAPSTGLRPILAIAGQNIEREENMEPTPHGFSSHLLTADGRRENLDLLLLLTQAGPWCSRSRSAPLKEAASRFHRFPEC